MDNFELKLRKSLIKNHLFITWYHLYFRSEATEIVNDGEIIHIPKPKPTLSTIEENIAFELALSSENTGTIRKLPIKIDDVIDALRVSSIHNISNDIFLLYI